MWRQWSRLQTKQQAVHKQPMCLSPRRSGSRWMGGREWGCCCERMTPLNPDDAVKDKGRKSRGSEHENNPDSNFSVSRSSLYDYHHHTWKVCLARLTGRTLVRLWVASQWRSLTGSRGVKVLTFGYGSPSILGNSSDMFHSRTLSSYPSGTIQIFPPSPLPCSTQDSTTVWAVGRSLEEWHLLCRGFHTTSITLFY